MAHVITNGKLYLCGVDSSRRHSKRVIYQWSSKLQRLFTKNEAEQMVKRIRDAGCYAEVVDGH